ncbi:MAG: ribosomal L7Ae/L30e/S12e/Gadd45 family protein [Lachnospiraceae bacterium]|nr:ribosomal L7Ae/L30e/S12e/Gadd45 family protein [Lachnospiraceae bacterium]
MNYGRRWRSLNNTKFLRLLGMARRAGKVESGSFLTERAVRAGKAALVVIAEDASENTKKDLENVCRYYKVPFYIKFSKAELAGAIGEEERVSAAVTDPGFAAELGKLLCK